MPRICGCKCERNIINVETTLLVYPAKHNIIEDRIYIRFLTAITNVDFNECYQNKIYAPTRNRKGIFKVVIISLN